MEPTLFKGVHPCNFPAKPGSMENHLIVVDIVDKAIFVGDPNSDEWQDFPLRLPVPFTRFVVHDHDLTVECSCGDDILQAVNIMFRTRIDFQLFMTTARKVPTIIGNDPFEEAKHKSPIHRDAHGNGSNLRHSRSLIAPEHPRAHSVGSSDHNQAGHDTTDIIPDESMERVRENHVLASELESAMDNNNDEETRDDEVAHLMRNKTAGDLCSNLLLPIVDEDTKLASVVDEFRNVNTVLLTRMGNHARDTVITKDGFMSRVLLTGMLDMGVGQWENEVLPRYGTGGPPELATVDQDTRLIDVVSLMVRDSLECVAVQNEQCKIIGVLTKDELFTMVVRDVVNDNQLRDRKSAGAHTVKKHIRFETQDDPLETMGPFRRSAAQWVSSAGTECFTMVLLLIDICLTIYDSVKLSPCVDCKNEWATTDDYDRTGDSDTPFASLIDCKDRLFNLDCEVAANIKNPLNMVTGVILGIFLLESLVRLFAFRMAVLRSILDIFDLVIVWASCGTFMWMILGGGNKDLRQILTIGRVMRFLRLLRMAMWVRKMVSKKRNRYRQNGFDLDLSYVTDNCIAMSLPATGMEAKYRNPLEEVVRFFRLMHQDHNGPKYLVFNLAAERPYSPQLFDGNVESFPAEDHHPCLLEQICSFVERCESFLVCHPKNVIAVHCKGGKGRTGVMVVCWLLYSGFSTGDAIPTDVTPEQDALEWFALKRTGDRSKHYQGVSQPSQRRYINYFYKTMTNGGYKSPSLILHKIIMYTCPRMDTDGGCDPWFVVDQKYHEVFDYSKFHKVENMSKGRQQHEFLCNDLEVRGDIRVTFFDHDEVPPRDEKMFFFWSPLSSDTFAVRCAVLTWGLRLPGFIENNYLSLSKKDVDGASSDKSGSVYKEDFRIELIFKPVERSRIPHRKLQKASRTTYDLSASMSARLRMEAEEKANNQLNFGNKVLKDNYLTSKVRGLVSGDKVRFTQDGFDLDLTYITKNVIAMGYPAQGKEGFYRNPAEEVRRFFSLRHPNKFIIYNLCAEREYNLDNFFKDSTRVYPTQDHLPPPLKMIKEFCTDCQDWLGQHPDNVAAVHCLAGKGRTGVMICCFILHSGLLRSAAGSIQMFNELRSTTRKGVTVPSQVRFVNYYEQLMNIEDRGITLPLGPNSSPISLLSIAISSFPGGISDGTELHVEIKSIEQQTEEAAAQQVQYRSADHGPLSYSKTGEGTIEIALLRPDGVRLAGDVRLALLTKSGGVMEEVMSCCLNTTLLGSDFAAEHDTQILFKDEIDPNRKSRGKGFDSSLRMTLSFSRHGVHPLASVVNFRTSSAGNAGRVGSSPHPAKRAQATASLDFAATGI